MSNSVANYFFMETNENLKLQTGAEETTENGDQKTSESEMKVNSEVELTESSTTAKDQMPAQEPEPNDSEDKKVESVKEKSKKEKESSDPEPSQPISEEEAIAEKSAGTDTPELPEDNDNPPHAEAETETKKTSKKKKEEKSSDPDEEKSPVEETEKQLQASTEKEVKESEDAPEIKSSETKASSEIDEDAETSSKEAEPLAQASEKPVEEETEGKTPSASIDKSAPKDEESEEDEESEDDDDEDDDGSEDETDFNQLSRKDLVELLEQTVKEGDVEAIKKKVALIKVAFIKLNKEEQEKRFESFIEDGGEENAFEPEKDDTEIRFNAAFSIYKEKKAKYIEDQEKLKQKNLETKKLILEELKALIESEESLKTTYDEFRDLQEKWKEAGMVPKSEVNNLWQSYHFYVEKFFDKVKINKELRDLDLKKNLELKIELCEAAEELLLESSIIKSFKKLQDLHRQWKETGPVPADKKDEIWERFKDATDKINQRRRDHYNRLKEDQKNNLLAKTALCEKAEEILQIENETIKDWQKNTDNISELLKVWKTIGPAPRNQNDEIWERFKTSLDTFFAGKKEFFQTIKDEQLNNYNLKLNLCAEAEALKTSTDWRKTTQDLINLQKEWKNIGPVPKRHSDKIWKRFRAACDEFFNSKSEFFANIKEHEAENLKQKEDLIKQVEEYEVDQDKNKNLEVMKDFQRQWMEIGHVPYKDKDRVQLAFRNAINNQLDKLNINKAEIRTVNYKQRIEGMKDRPNANRIINNERNFLIGKRKQLEEDIKLWENNMGFLASSKKADLLKEEFEKKIEKVKAEIEVLTEKIKFLERETD